jgi:hypothetical protein
VGLGFKKTGSGMNAGFLPPSPQREPEGSQRI